MSADGSLLSISISVDYPALPGALRDVRLAIQPGEMFGLVGQSGSGKSTLALAVLGLLSGRGGRVRGSIRFQGQELASERDSFWRKLRGRQIAFVPQSSISALNPALTLHAHFREAWRAHQFGKPDPALLRELMESVSLPGQAAFLERHPAELSVGQGQRVLIALALLHRPALIVADEPTSALDVITQSEILALFRSLNRRFGTAMLFISHDLMSVGALCNRIGILSEGELVECGEAAQILLSPQHEYSRKLLSALPRALHPADLESAG